ncbi:MAG TPA: HAD family hydrolase [Pseudonocardiaceae bacterium]|nr:HAD family hydrolase [Pseudonocardiaceae bacterium]
MADTRRQALLLDLDGTLYRGDGPVRAYADGVAATLAEADAKNFLSTVDEYLGNGVGEHTEPELLAATDGWEAVQRLATLRFEVGRTDLDTAFLASRAALAGPELGVEVPGGLLDALVALRPSTRIVLATNSPRLGLAALLSRLGADDKFDEIIDSAAKPVGLQRILAGIAEEIDARERPWRIFSVGDHWHNDIAPARDFGAVTGYIDRFGRADGEADAIAPKVEGILPTITAWAADPDAFHRA